MKIRALIPECPICGYDLEKRDKNNRPGFGCTNITCSYWKQIKPVSDRRPADRYVPLSYRPDVGYKENMDRLKMRRETNVSKKTN